MNIEICQEGVYTPPKKRKGLTLRKKRMVITPHGKFTSYLRASAALGYDRRTIQGYCKDSSNSNWFIELREYVLKRIKFRDYNQITSKPDRTPKKVNAIRKKAVSTPHGMYKSAKECAEALGVPYDTILYRLSRSNTGTFDDWYFLEVVKW
jgi:hypothetical protein